MREHYQQISGRFLLKNVKGYYNLRMLVIAEILTMSGTEAEARIKINKMLEEAGWRLCDDENGRKNGTQRRDRLFVIR